MNRQIVIVGRALGSSTADRALAELARRLSARLDEPVRWALLDHGDRSLHDALDECLETGARQVVVIPSQVPRDRYLETWSGKAIAHWLEQLERRGVGGGTTETPSATGQSEQRSAGGGTTEVQSATRQLEQRSAGGGAARSRRRHDGGDERDPTTSTTETPSATQQPEQPGPDSAPLIDVRVVRAFGETDSSIDALCAAANGPNLPVTDSPASFRSPSWSTISSHRHHVLVCRGPRCSSHGSPRVAKALAARLQAASLGDDDVLVSNTGCLIPCNLGPIVVVQPDDVWYTSVEPAAVDRIVSEHLGMGRVVEDLRTPRSVPSPAPPSPEEA